mmetsp:Transcript_1434/g.2041  ORF Transcript_1434/g.2041 Transcript_1434/m.2041 type:complete len:214 (+) Transcript_1434:816-1457(+)
MLGTHTGGGTVGSAEHHGALDLTCAHVQGFGSGVDDVVNGLHCKVESHELDDRLESRHGGSHSNSCEPSLCDGGVIHALRTKLLQQPASDLVCALVLSDLLAHDVHLIIPGHLLLHSRVNSVPDSQHLGVWANGCSHLHIGRRAGGAQRGPLVDGGPEIGSLGYRARGRVAGGLGGRRSWGGTGIGGSEVGESSHVSFVLYNDGDSLSDGNFI